MGIKSAKKHPSIVSPTFIRVRPYESQKAPIKRDRKVQSVFFGALKVFLKISLVVYPTAYLRCCGDTRIFKRFTWNLEGVSDLIIFKSFSEALTMFIRTNLGIKIDADSQGTAFFLSDLLPGIPFLMKYGLDSIKHNFRFFPKEYRKMIPFIALFEVILVGAIIATNSIKQRAKKE